MTFFTQREWSHNIKYVQTHHDYFNKVTVFNTRIQDPYYFIFCQQSCIAMYGYDGVCSHSDIIMICIAKYWTQQENSGAI